MRAKCTDAAGTDAVLTHLSWEDRAWLHHFPLNRDTVLDYFSNSQASPYGVPAKFLHAEVLLQPTPCTLTQFYDRTCLNEQIKMQQGLSREEADEMIKQMTGIQYAALPQDIHQRVTQHKSPCTRRYTLEHAHEQAATPTSSARTLYVIQKARRTASSSRVEAIRLYHVLDGVAYEIPSLQAVLSARLARLSWLLGSAFSAVQEVTSPDAAAMLQAGSASAADTARCRTSGTSDGAAAQPPIAGAHATVAS
jgi:hypothetical protein